MDENMYPVVKETLWEENIAGAERLLRWPPKTKTRKAAVVVSHQPRPGRLPEPARMGNSLNYPSFENPARVERYLDNKGNPNRVFNLKDEMGPREDWRHKLHSMGEKPSLAMIVADYTTGNEATRQARIAVLHRLLTAKADINYRTGSGVRLVDVLQSKGDYYPVDLIRRADPETYMGASVAIVKGTEHKIL